MSRVLDALRVRGSLLLHEGYAPPWGVAVPGHDELRRLLGQPADARLVAFHIARRGAFQLTVGRRPPRVVHPGELALVASGAPHALGDGGAARPVALEAILAGRRPPVRGLATTELVCGVFVLHDPRFNPLFRTLPEVLQVPIEGPGAGFVLGGVTGLLAAELGGHGAARPWIVARLLELLCSEVVTAARPAARWLTAVDDRAIGAALNAFHADPGAGWTVARLARPAALSPSRFSARFRELLREPPMAYVARWRLAVAAEALRAGAVSVDAAGRAVGYDSLAAFSRAFKRQWGVAPSRFRAAAPPRAGAVPRGGRAPAVVTRARA